MLFHFHHRRPHRALARLHAGQVVQQFVEREHIAGIVNPPSANKYGYWTNEAKAFPETPDAWFEGAKQNEGSWWPDWQKWVTGLDGAKVPARDPAKGKLKVLEDAPGSFVKFRLDSQKKAK